LTSHATFEEFCATVTKFCQASGATLIKVTDFADGHPDRDPEEDRRDEKFHEAIKASAKVSLPGLVQNVQFVLIRSNTIGHLSVEEQLNDTSDLPSCVSYKVLNGKKFFTIPEKGREALFTRRVNRKDICPARLEKYQARGYDFY
jgi:hypothetical protein